MDPVPEDRASTAPAPHPTLAFAHLYLHTAHLPSHSENPEAVVHCVSDQLVRHMELNLCHLPPWQ